MKRISISEILATYCEVEALAREMKLIASNDERADIRAAHKAWKAAVETLRYDGYSDKEIAAIIRRLEKHFGL